MMAGVAHAVTLGNPFPVAATTGQEFAASAAFDGTNYLVGIQGDTSHRANITAQLVSPSGSLVGSRISVGRTGGLPLVAFDGANYLMIWFDDATSNGQLYGVFVSKAGSLVGTPFVIDPGPLSASRGIGGIAFGGGKYLPVYYKADSVNTGKDIVYGRLVSPSGAVENEIRISSGLGKQTENNVAFDGTNFFVVWCDNASNNEVKGRLVNPSGTLETEMTVKASGLPNDNPLTVAFDGTNYLVVWTDQITTIPNNWDVFGQLVTPAGALSGGRIPINTAQGPQFLPFIAFDGTNYLISWTDMRNDTNGNWACDAGEETCWDIRGQFVSKSGVVVGSEFIINKDPGDQLGGFSGQAVDGRLFGLINTGVNMAQGSFGDVYGVFMTVESSTAGACGTANGQSFTSAPSADLCFAGTASGVTGSGPWSWTCSGVNGGTTANCTAGIIQTWTVTPSAGTGGTINPNTPQTVNHNATTQFTVTANAGYTASVGGTCGGSLNGTTYTTNAVTGNCTVSATLTANPVNGACGSANGQSFTSAPSADLCFAGTASGVTGGGPWTWSCAGLDGGSTANCTATFNQTLPAQKWAKTYGGQYYDEASLIKQTIDGGYIVTGATTSFGGSNEVWVLKLNAEGNIDWQKIYKNAEKEAYNVKSIEVTGDGGYILTGYANTCCVVYGWLLKINADGAVLWQKGYTTGGPSYFNAVRQTSDGGYIAAGAGDAIGTVTARPKPWVVKVDNNGNIEWQKLLTYESGNMGEFYDIKQTKDGGYIITGKYFTGITGFQGILVIKMDSVGNIEWKKFYSSEFSGFDMGLSIQQTVDDGYIVAGQVGYPDGLVLKLDKDGKIEWQKKIGDTIQTLNLTDDGGYVIGGPYQSGGVVLKLNQSGDIQWQKDYNFASRIPSIQQTSDHGYIMTSTGTGTHNGQTAGDILVIKTDENGNINDCALIGNAALHANNASLIANELSVTISSPEMRIINTISVPMNTDVQPEQICPYVFKGDINGDSSVDLEDAILALQVVAGMNPSGIRASYPACGADVNGDGKIGLPEVIDILQKVAGLR
jgi:hypothetical protein